MEKVLYALTRPPATDPTTFRRDLLDTAERLGRRGALAVQVNVVDDDVAPAAGLRIVTSDAPADAVVAVWVASARESARAPLDEALAEVAATLAAYLVTESVPLDESRPSPTTDGRTDGFAQLAFLRRPADLAVDDWFTRWFDDHTPVALETQDTSLYVQHAVVRPLTAGAPPWDAIVEEGFPDEAMTDPQAFFDARGDDDRLARHQQAMLASVQRFIDLTTIEVVPTSRYVLGRVDGPPSPP